MTEADEDEEWISSINMMDIIDEALKSMKDFPYGVLYEGLCRQKAMLLLESGREEEAVAYFCESFGATIRERVVIESNLLKKAQMSKQSLKVEDNGPIQADYLKFGEPITADTYLRQLAALPSEWTIVQISQLECGPSLLPPRVHLKRKTRTKPLVICRLGCGSNSSYREVRYVKQPMPMPFQQNADILHELKSLIEENLGIKKFGTVSDQMKKRKDVETRFKTLVAAVTNWLAEHRCLLLGRIANSVLEAELKRAVQQLSNTLKVPEHLTSSLSLLVQGASFLSDIELSHGLNSLLPKTSISRARQLQSAVKAVKSLAISLDFLDTAPRHHVILILDKTLYTVPWEMIDILKTCSASRMPCLALTHALYVSPSGQKKLDANSAYFVVDPANDLPNTAKRLQPVMLARPSWKGTISTAPPKSILEQALKEQDIYLYCGHGGGMHLLPPQGKFRCNSAAIIVGCSSSAVSTLGPFWEMHGVPLKLMLSGSPAMLGMLWNVLDRDADRMTVHLLESCVPPVSDNLEEYRKKLEKEGMLQIQSKTVNKPCQLLQEALGYARDASLSCFIAGAFVANGLPMTVQQLKK